MPRRKREIDNFLQSLDKSANIKFGMIYRDMLDALSGLGFDTSTKQARQVIRKAFADMKYRQAVESATIDASVEAVRFPMQDFASVKVDDYIGWIKSKPYAGSQVTLSEVIRQNATEASREIQSIVTAQIKRGTNWKKLSREINKVDRVGDVASVISDIAEDGMRLLPTAQARRDFRRKLTRAREHIARLSPDHAPTKQLKKAYAGVLDAVTTRDKDIIRTAMDRAFKQKINYNNDRIARTEMARAYDLSFHARIEDDPAVTGKIWELSARHPITDICDYYAELDSGKGAGVYSKEDFPHLPAHPNCLCMMTIYTGEPPKKLTQKNSRDYLNRQPKEKRNKIIGKNNSEYKTRYIDGLKQQGVDFDHKAKRLPKYLIERGEV